jgi:hypothetical protein
LFKYTKLVAIPDRSTPTVGSALLSIWLCRHGLPLEIVQTMVKNSAMKKWIPVKDNENQKYQHNLLPFTHKCPSRSVQ